MMVCLLGLLRTERLANDMSAVTRVMDILEHRDGTLVERNAGVETSVRRLLTLPALKLVFQEVEERFLHHVGHLQTEEWGGERTWQQIKTFGARRFLLSLLHIL